jgi:NTE family protein
MRSTMKGITAVLLSVLVSSQAFAAPWLEAKPRICLVLKGGGALGFAHVGVLKVLEENRIPVHCIAGTSMGSIVGAAYASGASMAEITKVLSTTDWGNLFGEKVDRANLDYRMKPGRNREIFGDTKVSFAGGKLQSPMGIVEGQNIRLLFQQLFGYPSADLKFDDLPLPFRAVTTDIETAETYVPEQGDLSTIVRASMSVPGAFAPIQVDGRMLVDGGLTDNLPVDVALGLGADVLIVVDLKSELAKQETLTTPFSITGQMVSMLLMQNATLSRKLVREGDVVIEPNVAKYAVTDFDKAKQIAEIGEKAAGKMVDAFAHLALSSEEYTKYRQRRERPVIVADREIQFVRIKNNSKISDRRILKEAGLKKQGNIDLKAVEKGVQKLYQTGYFKTVQYSLVEEDGKTGVELNTDAKSWLDSYVRLGFAIEDNLDRDDNFRLALAYRTTSNVTDGYSEVQAEIGKTPQLFLEHYQMLGADSNYFVDPSFRVGQTDVLLRSKGIEIAEYQREFGTGSLAFGRRIGTLGEISTFYSRGWGDISRQVGDPSLPDLSYDQADLGVSLVLDRLDRPDFPTSGYSFYLGYTSSLEDLGASDDFETLNSQTVLPISFGRNTFILGNSFAHSFGDLPVERSYSLGGFLSVSGAPLNSITASNYLTNQLVYFRRFSEAQNPFFDLAFYAGGSVEQSKFTSDAENLDDLNWVTGGSVFVGADTPILPVYIAYGVNDNEERSISINFGRIGRSRFGN